MNAKHPCIICPGFTNFTSKIKNKTLLQTVEEHLKAIEGRKFPTIEVDMLHDVSRRAPSVPMGFWSCMHNSHIQNLQKKKLSIKSNSFHMIQICKSYFYEVTCEV